MLGIYRGRTLFSSIFCLILYVPWVCKIKTEEEWSMKLSMNEAWMKLTMIVNDKTASVEPLGGYRAPGREEFWKAQSEILQNITGCGFSGQGKSTDAWT